MSASSTFVRDVSFMRAHPSFWLNVMFSIRRRRSSSCKISATSPSNSQEPSSSASFPMVSTTMGGNEDGSEKNGKSFHVVA